MDENKRETERKAERKKEYKVVLKKAVHVFIRDPVLNDRFPMCISHDHVNKMRTRTEYGLDAKLGGQMVLLRLRYKGVGGGRVGSCLTRLPHLGILPKPNVGVGKRGEI